jgi:hypothetical protein
MASQSSRKCRCCLKIVKPTESVVLSSKKIEKMFENVIGFEMSPGAICGRCNLKLLSLNAFWKEITRKHIDNRSQMIMDEELKNVKFVQNQHPATETVLNEEKLKDKDEETEFIIQEIDPNLTLEQLDSSELESQAKKLPDNDDNDVIVLSSEPPLIIDLDEITDDSEQEEMKIQENLVMYKCEHCLLENFNWEMIVTHIKQSHTYPCTECNKIFSNFNRLMQHQLKSHS